MELLKTMLGGAAGATIIGGVFSLIQWWLNRRATKEDNEDRKEEEDKNTTAAEVTELKDMIGRLVVADRTVLYDRIKHLGKSYIARGYVTIEELEDLDQMHGVYHTSLNGNGFLDNLMKAVHALPVRAE